MDKPFLVVISGCHQGTFKTLQDAEQSAKNLIAGRKKMTSAIIYKAVETIEPVQLIPDWKVTPADQIPKPEPGYQPEGFTAQNTADAGPAGFGSDFGTSLE